MNPEIKDGGPAFPVQHHVDLGTDRSGMSLRDWFAGQIAAAAVVSMECEDANLLPSAFKYIAEQAYNAADAMLVAREKGSK